MMGFTGIKENFPYAIFIYYWPFDGAWIRSSDCPNIANKWECAFLPMTNCSIPNFILDCHSRECIYTNTRHVGNAVLSDKATSDGVFIDKCGNGDDSAKTKQIKNRFGHAKLPHQTYIEKESLNPPNFKFAAPYNKTLFEFYNAYGAFQARNAMFDYLFMTRPNAFYRVKMQELVHEMRSRNKPYFTSNIPCIAVQLRRGDRSGYGINMNEFCSNSSYDSELTKHNDLTTPRRGCVNFYNHSEFDKCPDYEGLQDFGCYTVPFGSVTLQNVVDKVQLLVNPIIYDLLVFTDDPIWLEEEIQSLSKRAPQWRIHALKSPTLPSEYTSEYIHATVQNYIKAIDYVRSGGATASGIYLQSSLRLAQQCSAFISHFGSGVASLFYAAMCIQHGNKYGVCPPQYDLRWGLENDFHRLRAKMNL